MAKRKPTEKPNNPKHNVTTPIENESTSNEINLDVDMLLNAISTTQAEQVDIQNKILNLQQQQTIVVKFKKLDESAEPPQYITNTSAGADLTVTYTEYDRVHNIYKYHTGLAVEIPEGYVGLLFPKSSITDYDLILANCVGVIDSDYRGEICAKFRPIKHRSRLHEWLFGHNIYYTRDKCVQLIILPYPKINFVGVEKLSETERGTRGFGEMDEQFCSQRIPVK